MNKLKIIKKFLFFSFFLIYFILIATPAQANTCQIRTEFINSLGMRSGGCLADEEIGVENKCPGINPIMRSYNMNTMFREVCCCSAAESEEQPLVINPPRFTIPELQVNLGVEFTTPNCSVGSDGKSQCEINWLGVYLTAIYNYALKFGGILAAMMLMAGGLFWLISGGDPGKIKQAKNIISGSLIGLALLFSSYLILEQINPELVVFKPITLGRVGDNLFPDNEYTEGETVMPESYVQACAAAKNNNLEPCRALGNSQPSGLVSQGNVLVNEDTLNKFNAAMQCVANKNNGKILFEINEGFRSAIEQIRIKEKYTAQGKPQNAATPCCSNHSSGIAIDIKRIDGKPMSWEFNESSGLTLCMNAVGLYARIDNEPWHWSPSGR